MVGCLPGCFGTCRASPNDTRRSFPQASSAQWAPFRRGIAARRDRGDRRLFKEEAMSVPSRLLVHLVCVVMLLGAPATAASAETHTDKAANGAVERTDDDRDDRRPRHDTDRIVTNEEVTWTIPAGQCPTLPAGSDVNGRGRRHAVTTTTVR